MKQLLILATLIFVACEVQRANSAPQVATEDTGDMDTPNVVAREFTYKKHSYISFYTYGTRSGKTLCVLHDPECKCLKQK